MPFEKGSSGNPAGRKAGSTPGSKLKQAIIDDMPDIIQAMISQAKLGDVTAAKVLIDKIIPSLKPQSPVVTIAPGSTLSESGQNVLNAVMDGSIPADVASALLTSLANQAKLIEVTELVARLEKLENA